MELISMTDFVLEQTELYKEDKLSVFDFALRVKKYANFLKQPLKLEMFVSDDKEKVLFKNAQIDTYDRVYCGGYVFEIIKGKTFGAKKTIEDLIDGRNIELTENATKQFL